MPQAGPDRGLLWEVSGSGSGGENPPLLCAHEDLSLGSTSWKQLARGNEALTQEEAGKGEGVQRRKF